MPALFFLSVCAQGTHINVGITPGGSETEWLIPNYYSGTNCRASFTILDTTVQIGIDVAAVNIALNEEIVKTVTYPPPPGYPNTDGIVSVMFDSTHFAPYSTVLVSGTVIYRDGSTRTYYGESVQILNRAVIYGRDDMEGETPVTWNWTTARYGDGDDSWRTCSIVAGLVGGMNYPIYSYMTAIGWSHEAHLLDVSVATVLYVASHGGSGPTGRYWTDINDYVWQRQANPEGPPDWPFERITGTTSNTPSEFPVLPVRIAANGEGLPPFNTGNPPINLAFIMACETSLENDDSLAAGFLYPYGNWYTGGWQPYPENQAQCGYVIKPSFGELQTQAKIFFESLAAGWWVHAAREFAEHEYPGFDSGGNHILVVWGDWATKLKGVYSGDPNADADASWFR